MLPKTIQDMSSYSIKDLEQLSGIKAHTLRIWEQRFNFIQPQRTETNIRYYDNSDLKQILNISLLKDHGYKISEIAKLSSEELHSEVNTITEGELQYPDQLKSLTRAMIDIDEEAFEDIINGNIAQHGFKNTMVNVIYPFLSKVGILWITGSVGPSQEHFMTNLIRQKLIVEIDKLPRVINNNKESVVIYTPEGEFHEIGILFAHYIFKSENKKVIYLGQSLPFEDIRFVVENNKPTAIFTAFTTLPSQNDVQIYIKKLEQNFPHLKIFLTGMQVIGQNLEIGKNSIVVKGVDQLTNINL